MVARKRRRYTAKEQAAVLADVDRLGVCGAARKHGIPQSCVSRWKTQAAQSWGAGKARARRVKPKPVLSEKATEAPQPRVVTRARRYTPSEKAQAVEYPSDTVFRQLRRNSA